MKRERAKKIIIVEIMVTLVLLLAIILVIALGINGNKNQKPEGGVLHVKEEDSSSGKDTAKEPQTQTEDSQSEEEPVPEHKVVYLTFDDGPGKHTQTLLDILDKYNVKVTFFVTNQFPGYLDMITEEAKRGHTVAIHTYSHKYEEVYQSPEGYIADLQKMEAIIKEKTGQSPKIFRFPGGSASGKAKEYCPGITQTLSKKLQDMGYTYFDWNVTSGDAGQYKTAEEVANSVITGIQKHDVSVVLQHDIHEYSVNAVETILKWGIENGYTFLPLKENSPECHFNISN